MAKKRKEYSSSDEDEHSENSSSDYEEEQVSKPKPIQVNPLHAEKIVRQIMIKPKWHSKLEHNDIVKKWRRECTQQGISQSSFDVALDILKDIKLISHSQKICCGECGAKPKKKLFTDPNSDEEVNENEPLFDGSLDKKPQKKKKKVFAPLYYSDDEDDENYEDERPSYSRSTRFCLCPCAHCAFKERQVGADVCIQNNDWIPKGLTERLKKHLNSLVYSTPVEEWDWHPGSNGQVLDIIHPSLYCYSKEYSVLRDDSKGLKKKLKSINTQWLPTDFQVEKDNTVKPLSYINNIDPISQKDLQDTICEVLSHLIQPIRTFVNVKKKVQVIVKAANIIVTPEQGFYPGGTWHTEGDTENIVATAIYYYECKNIKDSMLEFRTNLDEEDFYSIEQDNVTQAWNRYGIHDQDKLFSVVGNVKTTEGKCIFFPNSYQHRVKHFFPENPTKEATRKILVFFFVDPEKPIVSTSNIDIQRKDFIMSQIFPLVRKIPYPVIVKEIIPFLPLMNKKQAHKVRDQLMESRKFKRDNENELYEREFSLCEH